MRFSSPGHPLIPAAVPVPEPGPDQLLIRVRACGVCRTDLHVVDGELPHPKPNVVPGHEVVGTVERAGERVDRFGPGQRVGVPWLGWTCGECQYSRAGCENQRDRPKFTGHTRDGGYAEYLLADLRYCFQIPEGYSDAEGPRRPGLAGEPQLRLVDQGGRLEVVARALASQAVGGQPPQCVVNEREEVGSGLAVPGRGGPE